MEKEMSAKEYDLKASEDIVGQLYPVLLSKEEEVIDGYHRLEADKDWRTEILEHIDTEEKLLIARCISNWHRRAVQWSEKEAWINGLAMIYKKQGYKIRGEYPVTGGSPKNEIVEKIIEITGLSEQTITRYLSEDYKQKEQARTSEQTPPRVPASQRIETELGPEYVERHREEIRREIAEEVKEEVVEEVKEELRRDPGFVEEVAEEYRKKKVDELLTEVLGEEKEDVEGKRRTERYHGMVVSTFYRVMGWGVPMVLAMGREQWDKTLPYIAGIQNRMDFLLAIKPDASLDEQPEEPKIEVQVDRRKIVEAEYQILEG